MAGKLHKRWGKGCCLTVWSCRVVLTCVLSLLLSASAVHPYYVSVTEIEYKPAEKEVQIAGKLFIDDLEYALAQEFKTKVAILNPADKKKNEELLTTFFQKHLKISIDGKPASFQLLGFDREEEAIWTYLEIKQVNQLKTVTVFNDLLYSFRQDQVNIIHFINRGNRKSQRLTYPDTQVHFSW